MMRFELRLLGAWILIAALVLTTRGVVPPVIIDDRDTSIVYACQGTANWEYYGENSSVVDTTHAYGQSIHVNWKNEACSLQFPFLGSGLTFYILDVSGFGPNVNVSIDHGPKTAYALPTPISATPCPNNISFCGQANTSLFNIQGLGAQAHSALVEANSPIFFDFVLMNQTFAYPSNHHGSAVGAICGGVLACLVVVAVVVALLWRAIRRGHIFGFGTNKRQLPQTEQPILGERNVSFTSPDIAPESTSAPFTPIQQTGDGFLLSLPALQHGSVDQSADVPVHEPPAYSEHLPASPPAQSPAPSGSVTARSPLTEANDLTEEETRYVNSLYDLDVPTPAIANVIRQLISRRQGGSGRASPLELPSPPPPQASPPAVTPKGGSRR